MKNKVLIVCVVLVGLCASTALALDPMGPPATGLSQGQWSVGLEYAYSEMHLYREQSYSSGGHKFNTEMNKYYARLGYGISAKTEGFVRLGLSDLDYERGTAGNGVWKGDDDGAFTLGLGLKTTFHEDGNIKWGGLAQVSWAEYTGTRKNPSASNSPGKFETQITEFQLAAGPTYKMTDLVSVYGGPFLHVVNGDHTHYHQSSGNVGRYGLNEKTNLGVYVGTQVDINANTALTVEYHRTSDDWAIAGGVAYRF